jgi:microcin C transport system permease protein
MDQPTVPIAETDVPAKTAKRSRLARAPIVQRRWANFKANRRGYWSLWVFLGLFLVTLFAEFIANDRPIVVMYRGELLFPVFVNYPESKFGGFLATTDYRDTYIQDEIDDNGWMVWPLIRYSYRSVNHAMPTPAPSPPWWTMSLEERCRAYPLGPDDPNCNVGNYHWLGSDDQGRDVVARVIYGFRISVLFGLILAILSSIIGVIAGAVQGFYGGWVDLIFQRLLEIYGAIPGFYLLLIVLAILTPSFWIILFVMLLFSWTSLVGVVRAEFLRGRNFEYINAARALGLSNTAVMFRHLLPNAMVATLTFLPFIVNGSIGALTGLDFLGLGMPPGSPSLGELLQQGKENIASPWLGLTGFFVIAILMTLLVFVGEAVRDAFDPRRTFAAAATGR